MDEETKHIINDHKNPLTKISAIGPKLFFKNISEEAQEFISKNLENLENTLKHGKVEKRSARAKAEFIQSNTLVKINKMVKGLLETFGYQDKSGIYMYPEEMLYLMETNRMEVTLNNIPLSIQECYDIVLKNPEMNLKKYLIYKKLVLQGYKVVKYSEIIRKRNKKMTTDKYVDDSKQKKRELEDSEEICSESKRINIGESNGKLEKSKAVIEGILAKLKENCPRPYISEETEDRHPDYCVFFSNNTSKIEWDLNVYICEGYAIDQIKTDSKKPSIYAICSGNNISLYKIGTVHLPDL